MVFRNRRSACRCGSQGSFWRRSWASPAILSRWLDYTVIRDLAVLRLVHANLLSPLGRGSLEKPVKAVSRNDIADLVAAGDMGVNHRADVAVEFGRGALGPGFELGAQISALLPIDLHHGLAERQLHAFVTLQSRGKVLAGVADAVGEASGV